MRGCTDHLLQALGSKLGDLDLARELCNTLASPDRRSLAYTSKFAPESGSASDDIARVQAGVDAAFLTISGYLVFCMQIGFAMLCAGSVRSKNTMNILLKNVLDACVGAIAFWLIGYGVAYGPYDDTFYPGKDAPDSQKPPRKFEASEFIGHSLFGAKQLWHENAGSYGYSGYCSYIFQYFFAATAATIVSGSVAERASFASYLGYSFFLTAFVYPVVVHWVWCPNGWLSAFNVRTVDDTDPLNIIVLKRGARIGKGAIDYAGSGVVHMVGGVAGIMGSIFTGPRIGRFDADGKVNDMPGHSATLVTLGTFLLWFGWYGFNPGSALAITGYTNVVGRVALVTTLGAGAGGLAQLFLQYALKRTLDLINVCNGVLCGLVAITAGCSTLQPWAGVLAGILSAPTFHIASMMLKKLKIDDPLEAYPMHGACGMLALIWVGLMADPVLVAEAYGLDGYGGAFYSSSKRLDGIKKSKGGRLLGAQLIQIVVIWVWVGGLMAMYFGFMRLLKLHRVSEQEEQMGLDVSKHGGSAYHNENGPPLVIKKDVMQTHGGKPSN